MIDSGTETPVCTAAGEDVASLLTRVADTGVRLWASEGEVHFDGPVVSLPDTVVDELRRHREGILRHLSGTTDGIQVRPASAEQLRVWQSMQRIARPEVWTNCFSCHTGVRLDPAALQDAVNVLTARHEALRTGLTIRDGHLVREVHPTAHTTVEWIARRPGTTLHDICQQIAAPLRTDLSRPPLMRVAVVPAVDGRSEDTLILAAHHIVWDGATWGLVGRDLAAHYLARDTGVPPDLPASTPFSLFVERERAWAAETQEEVLRIRRAQLSPTPTGRLPMPRDQSPRARDDEEETSFFELPAPDAEMVQQTARRLRTTEFSLVLAAVSVLLAELTGHTDCVVAVSAACREEEDEETVGLLRRHLPVRLQQETGDNWGELAGRCARRLLEALQFPLLSCEALSKAWDPQGVSAFPQVVITHMPQEQLEIDLGNGPAPWEESPTPGARCDMTLGVRTARGRICGDIEVAASLVRTATRERWLTRFTELLTAAGRDPAGPVPTAVASGQEGAVRR